MTSGEEAGPASRRREGPALIYVAQLHFGTIALSLPLRLQQRLMLTRVLIHQALSWSVLTRYPMSPQYDV